MIDFPKTIFCDIDGIIFPHLADMSRQHMEKLELLPGAKEAFMDWEKKGYKIIITTGRRESTKEETIKQLKDAGLFFDDIILGLPRGPRVVINDFKPDNITDMAIAVNRERNKGLKGVDL